MVSMRSADAELSPSPLPLPSPSPLSEQAASPMDRVAAAISAGEA